MVQFRDKIREILVDSRDAFWQLVVDPAYQNHHVHELAPVILDYIRMRLKEYPGHGGIVEVEELTLRFRETPRIIKKVLRLLESEGHAEQTDVGDVWEIFVTTPNGDQYRMIEGSHPRAD